MLIRLKRGYHPHLCNYSGIYPIREGKCHPVILFLLFLLTIYLPSIPQVNIPINMSYNILGSGYRPNITLFSFDSTSAKIHKVSDSKAPENASWLEPGKEGVIYSTSEVPNGEVYSLKLQGEDLEITGKRSTKGEEPAHGM